MVSLTKIRESVDRIRTGEDFPAFSCDMREFGVSRIDVYMVNGMASFYCEGGHALHTAAAYANLSINSDSSVFNLISSLKYHRKGEFDFVTFCFEAAAAGVEKWVVDLLQMEVRYYDSKGSCILCTEIPRAACVS